MSGNTKNERVQTPVGKQAPQRQVKDGATPQEARGGFGGLSPERGGKRLKKKERGETTTDTFVKNGNSTNWSTNGNHAVGG